MREPLHGRERQIVKMTSIHKEAFSEGKRERERRKRIRCRVTAKPMAILLGWQFSSQHNDSIIIYERRVLVKMATMAHSIKLLCM